MEQDSHHRNHADEVVDNDDLQPQGDHHDTTDYVIDDDALFEADPEAENEWHDAIDDHSTTQATQHDALDDDEDDFLQAILNDNAPSNAEQITEHNQHEQYSIDELVANILADDEETDNEAQHVLDDPVLDNILAGTSPVDTDELSVDQLLETIFPADESFAALDNTDIDDSGYEINSDLSRPTSTIADPSHYIDTDNPYDIEADELTQLLSTQNGDNLDSAVLTDTYTENDADALYPIDPIATDTQTVPKQNHYEPEAVAESTAKQGTRSVTENGQNNTSQKLPPDSIAPYMTRSIDDQSPGTAYSGLLIAMTALVVLIVIIWYSLSDSAPTKPEPSLTTKIDRDQPRWEKYSPAESIESMTAEQAPAADTLPATRQTAEQTELPKYNNDMSAKQTENLNSTSNSNDRIHSTQQNSTTAKASDNNDDVDLASETETTGAAQINLQTSNRYSPDKSKPEKPYSWALNLSSVLGKQQESIDELNRLLDNGIQAELHPVKIKNMQWYRLRITGFDDQKSAIQYMQTVTKKTGIKKYWLSKNISDEN